MTQITVGLFLNSAQARKVTAELAEIDVPPRTLEVLDAYVSDLDHRLEQSGIPSDDRAIYIEGVRRGGALVIAAVEPELVDRVTTVMDDHGAADLDDIGAEWETAGRAASPEDVVVEENGFPVEESVPDPAPVPDRAAPEPELALAIMPEEREIELPNGMRLRTSVVDTPVEQSVTILREHMSIERRPANRAATESDFQAFEEGVIELVELAEELVVAKKVRVVEEIVITKKVHEHTMTIQENLKQTHLTTLPRAAGGSSHD